MERKRKQYKECKCQMVNVTSYAAYWGERFLLRSTAFKMSQCSFQPFDESKLSQVIFLKYQ